MRYKIILSKLSAIIQDKNLLQTVILSFILILPLLSEVLAIKNSLFFILVIINFANFMLLAFYTKKIFIPRLFLFLIIGFLVILIANLIFSIAIYRSLPFVILYFSISIFAVLYLNIKERKESHFLIFFLVGVVFLANILSFIFSNIPLNLKAKLFLYFFDFNQYLYSPTNTSNFTGILNMVVLLLFLPLFFEQNISFKKKVVYGLGLVPFLFFLSFSFMRSAYFGFIVSAVFFLMYREKRLKKKIIISVASVGIFILLVNRDFLSLISSFANPYNLEVGKKDYFGRFYLLLHGIKGFLERPLFGNGLGTYLLVAQKFTQGGISDISSHNIFIDILSELGIFGLVLIISLIGLLIKFRSKLKKAYAAGIYLSVLGIIVSSQTFSFLIFPGFLFLFVYLMLQLVVDEKILLVKHKNFIEIKRKILFIVIFLLFGLSQVMFIAKNIAQINSSFAKKIFPLFPDFYSTSEIANNEFIKRLVDKDYLYQARLSDYYKKIGLVEEELKHRLKAYSLFPYRLSFKEAKYIYQLISAEKDLLAAERFLLGFIEQKRKYANKFDLVDESYNFYIHCRKDTLPVCLDINYMYIPKPHRKEKNESAGVFYTYNNEGFNEVRDYPMNKRDGVYRILILGGPNAFGFLVNTQENWTEILERNLNKKDFPNIESIEIINLAYHNYDLNYQVARFLLQGKKYDPDLVIWLYNSFLLDQEIFAPILERYSYLADNPILAWRKAAEDYYKIVKEEEIRKRRQKYLQIFFNNTSAKVLFLSFSDPPADLAESLIKNNVVIVKLGEEWLSNPRYSYRDLDVLNKYGHKKIAEEIERILLSEIF